MGFQLHLDDQVTVTAGEHTVEVTVPAEATQRGARAQGFEAAPFPGVEGLRRGGVDDGLLGLAAGAGPDLPAVEESGTTLATDPALGERRCLDHAEHRAAALQQRDQRSEQRIPRDETLRAVDRVEHPGELPAPLGGELLAPNGVPGKGRANHAAHFGLDFAVCDRDRTAVAFALHGKRRAEIPPGNVARGIGELLGECRGCGKVRVLGEIHKAPGPSRRGGAFSGAAARTATPAARASYAAPQACMIPPARPHQDRVSRSGAGREGHA